MLDIPQNNRTFAAVSKKDSVAQLVEQLTLNQWVEGSSPSGVTSVYNQWFRLMRVKKTHQDCIIF